MNKILENIVTRRSVRSFTDKEINDEDINMIIKAGIYAPSGMNRQSWKFTVIQNKDIIKKLTKAMGETLGRENYDMYKPNTIILLSNDRDNSNGLADCSCALENIFLMAHSLGIGSCWINQLKTICDEPKIRTLLKEFEIPDNHIVWGIAALGYAAEKPNERINKEGIVKIIK